MPMTPGKQGRPWLPPIPRVWPSRSSTQLDGSQPGFVLRLPWYYLIIDNFVFILLFCVGAQQINNVVIVLGEQ